jgi:hypothetical protein
MIPIFILFSHSKVLGCDRLPPLKEISSRDLDGLEREKKWFGMLGGLPPLKETFLGSLGF